MHVQHSPERRYGLQKQARYLVLTLSISALRNVGHGWENIGDMLKTVGHRLFDDVHPTIRIATDTTDVID